MNKVILTEEQEAEVVKYLKEDRTKKVRLGRLVDVFFRVHKGGKRHNGITGESFDKEDTIVLKAKPLKVLKDNVL